ncbi:MULTISPECIES: ATP synthase F1 subunit delta [unclassified Mycoplasma]|uniref:ATP synthase F1 subunit delta n=1 Tax=unclassified Mycoplasma TaxID=2683645 RepID=UPI00211BCE8B|nr:MULTISPECIES: ATP synthase F1 subunit delta [unclassified Mycoplasma]UUM20043.1 ATP synthase F1 subunit delta [Mycoplasma sp. 1578d]UUM25023.1 ATP synthase F1 subunit delta [Mycoplasma sp. 3686d]
MLDKSTVKGYVIAIFELVKESNKTNLIHKQMNKLLNIIKANPELIPFLNNDLISKDDKLSLIDQILVDFDQLIINSVKVIIERKSVNKLKKIITHYLKLSNQALNISFVKVITAKLLSHDYLAKIQAKLEKQYNKTFELKHVVDPSLISGFKIVFDSKIIQSNYQNDLNELIGAITSHKPKGDK